MVVFVGVDVGGTFTDAVALVDGRVVTGKVPTTPRDQSSGVIDAVDALRIEPARIQSLTHGMTVATNALLERKGARTALVTTEGFRDIIEIARQNRADLYDLTAQRPEPLVPRALRLTVRERIAANGDVLIALDPESVREVVRQLEELKVQAVAVSLLFSFLRPEHERHVAQAIRDRLPGVHISLSSDVLPEFREYERCATTAADAYLTPRVGSYLSLLGEQCREKGYPVPEIMQSSGGTVALDRAAEHAAPLVLSGPAGGVVGAAYIAGLSGFVDLITLDMGGTSCDVALIENGRPRTVVEVQIAGVPIRLPAVDAHTVSAGGGSIAWCDAGGALRIGPMSAGAVPGPASYSLGGTAPTVTDANVALGYIQDGMRLGGQVCIDAEKARRAIAILGDTLGMNEADTAQGVIVVANALMGRAVRAISVERGYDPRDFSLLAFGGAGPMHACQVAEDLGIRTVLVPKVAGVLSALGLVVADRRRDYVHSFLHPLSSVSPGALQSAFAPLLQAAHGDLPSANAALRADLRYHGQSYELPVDIFPEDDLETIGRRFEALYEARFGYTMPGGEPEIVNVRVVATRVLPKPKWEAATSADEPRTDAARPAWFDGSWTEIPVLNGADIERQRRVRGPAIIEYAEATCVIHPRWSGRCDEMGMLILQKDDDD